MVIDPTRAEIVVTNDGTTMRIIAEKSATPSVWSRQPEVVTDNRAAATLHRHKLEQAVDEIEEPQIESIPEDTKQIDAGPTEATDTGDVTAASADSEGKESTADESSAAAEGSAAAVEMEKSDSVDHITRDNLDEKAPQAAADEAAKEAASAEAAPVSTEEKNEPTKKISDDAGTSMEKTSKRSPRTFATHKAAQRSSSAGAGAKTAQSSSKPTASHPTTSQATLQRAASKLKADAARKKGEEKQQEEARKKADEERRKREEKKIEEQRKYEEEIEKESREDERSRRREDRTEERQIRTEKRAFDAKRREDARKAIEAAANLKAASIEDLKKIAAQNQFAERFTGMLEIRNSTPLMALDLVVPARQSRTPAALWIG